MVRVNHETEGSNSTLGSVDTAFYLAKENGWNRIYIF